MAVGLSADTKDALARDVPEAPHCREALLRGLAIYGAHDAAFVTKRNAVARLFRLLSGEHFTRAPAYRLPIPPVMLEESGKPLRRCDRTMEARAAFLAAGSLSAGGQGYHLEFVMQTQATAERLEWILRALGEAPKRMIRKRRPVLYFKDFEQIVHVLTVIGAHGTVLRLEDVRALKETKNRIHRLVNTEAANMERSAGAAAGHAQTIAFVQSAYGIARLSPPLREIAELRIKHPDESLAELGRRCNPQISKPTVNSRLTALARLARRLRGESAARARKGA